MSETKFACPHCKQSLEGSDELFGQTVQCPSCKQNFTVPNATASLKIAPATPAPRTKACPFCGEDILNEAKKCKHCGETVDVALRAAEEAKKSASSAPHVFMNAGGGGGGAVSTGQTKKAFPHGMHLVLTILTCGAWAIIWILHYAFRDKNAYN